jgi:S-adenosylmethionine:tRNA ribosyltransferase-isomerase
MEMPSAGQALTWAILLSLKRQGVKVASLTHSAGLSSAGDDDIDGTLPFAERYEIPPETVEEIASARRIIAVGTTVVRAVEGSVRNNGGELRSGPGETDLIIDKNFQPAVVDGILTGLHDPSQSHFHLLRAFADEATLRRAWRHATEADYLCHEFGDLCLVLAS